MKCNGYKITIIIDVFIMIYINYLFEMILLDLWNIIKEILLTIVEIQLKNIM